MTLTSLFLQFMVLIGNYEDLKIRPRVNYEKDDVYLSVSSYLIWTFPIVWDCHLFFISEAHT
jgi:hypothetical protein